MFYLRTLILSYSLLTVFGCTSINSLSVLMNFVAGKEFMEDGNHDSENGQEFEEVWTLTRVVVLNFLLLA